ncbi:hypothetical protein [Methylocapsa aurea]|uniref:hypothetical protein n=1 Tax=Methylocapsa aurea TaxID=663610 RepID=UPI00056B78CF|nr:hypothetical protein [Methylocapsa aurea]
MLPSPALPIGWRRPLWIALLVAASVAFTLGFACAAPLAAFAGVAALTMPRQQALLLVGLVWFANQAVGFGVLHYPWTADTLAWGAGLGAVALLATLTAEWGAKRSSGLHPILSSTLAFLLAFAIYEGLLFAASLISQSGVEDYAPAIVGRIFAINAAAFIGLLAVNRLGASIGLVIEPRPQIAADAQRG